MRSRSAARGRVTRALLLFLFFPAPVFLARAAFAQSAVLYSDDFESGGTAAWQLPPGWRLAADGPNHFLSGAGHETATLLGGDQLGDILTFSSRIRLEGGSLHVNYRIAPSGGVRYFVRLEPAGITLHKSTPRPGSGGEVMDHVLLGTGSVPVTTGAWHALRITSSASRLDVWWDGTLQIRIVDPSPLVGGTVSFESLPETTKVDVDDVVLEGTRPTGPRWTFLGGPRGGIGYDLALDPRNPKVLWVTDAYAGAHQSTDGGLTWNARNNGITARAGAAGNMVPVFSLTIDRKNPDTIWAGTLGVRGVFKSTDGGATWVERDAGIPQQSTMEFRSFTVDPRDSSVVYCGGNYMADPATRKQRGFVHKTTDGGLSWNVIAEPGAVVRWILLDPTNPDTVFASTGIFDRYAVEPEGVLKSTDAGKTWRKINDGLTTLAVGALAMQPGNPRVLLAGTGKASGLTDTPDEIHGGVFKTTDGGEHWRQVDPVKATGGEQIRFSAIAFSPTNPSIVYANSERIVLRSTDAGETWTTLYIPNDGQFYGQPIAMVVHPDDPNTVFVNGYGGGVFKSVDGGRTWLDASAGYTGNQVWDVAVDPFDASGTWVGSKCGVWASGDAGEHWLGRNTRVDRADAWTLMFTSVAADPTRRDTWLLGDQARGAINRTTDGGATWKNVLPPLAPSASAFDYRAVYRIVFAPTRPATVYAATSIELTHVSYDQVGPGVWRSADGGLTWAAANGGLEETGRNVLAVAVDPLDADVVYAGLLKEGVFRSRDGGATWARASAGLVAPQIRSIAVDPFATSSVLAGAELGGVWRSTDAAGSWRSSSSGMPPEASIRALAFDPAHPGVVWAGDQASGVYRSTDHGATWVAVSDGLTNRAVNALALTSDGLRLYAATEGTGVFRLDVARAISSGPEGPVAESPRRIRP